MLVVVDVVVVLELISTVLVLVVVVEVVLDVVVVGGVVSSPEVVSAELAISSSDWLVVKISVLIESGCVVEETTNFVVKSKSTEGTWLLWFMFTNSNPLPSPLDSSTSTDTGTFSVVPNNLRFSFEDSLKNSSENNSVVV